MSDEHPAIAASRRSWSAVHRKAKEEWLALFAEDAVVEDPVGPSPLDPEGQGHRGKEAINNFWDMNIAPNTVKLDIQKSYAAGQEAAHMGTIVTLLEDGSIVTVEGIFVYKVNQEGLLVSLRAFWDFEKAMANITPPSGPRS